MSSSDQSLPALAPSRRVDSAAVWFWQFLKPELSPYPGRAWTVGRMTIAATLVMIIVMTFRLPYGFLGAVYTFFLSRENPTATFRAAVRTTTVYGVATVYTVAGITTLVGSPITHFLWIAVSLLLAFYVIRIVPDYFTAVGFGFTLAAAIPLWDETFLTVNQRTENTLWVGFSVVLGSAVTVAVEYVFRRFHPITDLREGIDTRLHAVEGLLRQIATGDHSFKFQKEVDFYASIGTSRLRRLLLRSSAPAGLVAQMNAAVALLGRLVDLASSLQIVRSNRFLVAGTADSERCLRLADQLAFFREDLAHRRVPRAIEIPGQDQPSDLPLLPEMERTVLLIPHAFSGSGGSLEEAFVPPPLDAGTADRLIVADAFSNPDYLKFAIRGGAATLLAYVVYQSIAWPGLSTSVATCIITALSTIGASRQKQFLRLGGVVIGGLIFGIGGQVFVLPFLNSISGFTVFFVLVTAVCAWVATATPRLSYLGVQAALAFYLINLQEFTIQDSLAVARDRLVGVLLGLVCMWLVFDRLWVKNALQEMQEAFARNLRLMAQLMEESLKPDRVAVAAKVLQLRDQINEGFNAVKAQGDAVLFEFGPSRERKLQIRDDVRRWQPTLRILLQVQVTFLQYLFEQRLPELPDSVAKALARFGQDMATTMGLMSDEVCTGLTRVAPDVQESAAGLREEIQRYYAAAGVPMPSTFGDLIALTQNLASIISPLYADIHVTFTTPHLAAVHHPRMNPQQV